MCSQQSLQSACAYLLHILEFLSLKGGCTGWFEPYLVSQTKWGDLLLLLNFFFFPPKKTSGQVLSNHWTDCSEILGYGCEVAQGVKIQNVRL